MPHKKLYFFKYITFVYQGCSTKYSRTSINKRKSEEEERERETERRAERLKLEGNDCFTKVNCFITYL